MSFPHYLKNLCLDFLFPQRQKVLELENLTVDELLATLPPSDQLEHKYSLAIFSYSHPVVKELIWELKYNGNIQIADKLGQILYDVISHDLRERAIFEKWSRPILIPIPISGKRRLERGWNQSELLVEKVLSHDREHVFKYLPKQLIKLRHTESQTKTASRNERLKNVTNSMKVLNPASVRGECVVVIDDVTTTGATFREAHNVLREAGAKKILCIALAH